MCKRRYMFLFLLLLILFGITGCSTGGIHLFSVQVVGEVRESSVLQQPLKGVKIFTPSGEELGSTDESGKFSIEVVVRQGKIKLLLQHPDYAGTTVEETLDGRYQKIIDLPSFYLSPAGGEIQGRVNRTIPEPLHWVGQAPDPSTSVDSNKHDNIVEREYNLVTRKGREWLLHKLSGRGQIISESVADLYTVRLDSKEEEEAFLQGLNLTEDVEYIEPNCYVYLQGLIPEEERLPELWNMFAIGMPVAWQLVMGQGVKVGVLDSLYLSNHPDLERNLLSPLDVYGNDEEDPRLGRHGTHVAGIIGAVVNQDGVLGVAPHVSLLPVRVFTWDEYGRETATVDAIVRGINLARKEGVQVMNMSFGMPGYNKTLHNAIQTAYAAGIVLVAASGNNGSDQMLYPARFPEVIGVGAVGPDGERAYYSQYGEGIELMAPGGNIQFGEAGQILSTIWDEDRQQYSWGYQQGTSMAAPHVSGLAALLISYGITDPDYIRLILRETAKDMGATGYDEETGYGLIDAAGVLGLFQHSYVFFGSVQSGYAQVRSPVRQVAVNGEYILTGVRPGTGRVIGWIDINHNFRIDPGDYLGESNELNILEDHTVLTGVELTLTRVEGDFTAIEIGKLLGF